MAKLHLRPAAGSRQAAAADVHEGAFAASAQTLPNHASASGGLSPGSVPVDGTNLEALLALRYRLAASRPGCLRPRSLSHLLGLAHSPRASTQLCPGRPSAAVALPGMSLTSPPLPQHTSLSHTMIRTFGVTARAAFRAHRTTATRSVTSLKDVLAAQIPGKQAELKRLKTEHGDKSLGEVTVDQCIGGARGVKCMLWETSLLDADEGIRFRGKTIPELQGLLPSYGGPAKDGEPLPEGLIWLLLTGEVPTKEQCDWLTAELHSRSELPAHVEPLMRSLPHKTMHPMTQLSIGVMACQTDSKFAKAYKEHAHKSTYWEHTYEDMLDLFAKLPKLAALVYRCTYHDGVVQGDKSLDYSADFCRMLGYDDPKFDELMRLYLVIHSDHEGGNASAHTTHLVGSTLADPWLSYSAGLNSLAGPLHGLANQEVLAWIQGVNAKFEAEGKEVNEQTIKDFAWETLNAGNVIPGYGHAVLRKTDPRCVRLSLLLLLLLLPLLLLRPLSAHHYSTSYYHCCCYCHNCDFLAHLASLQVHVPARVRAQAPAGRQAVQDRRDHLPGRAGRPPRARQGQEPVAQRRQPLGRPAVALQLYPVRVLHRPLRRVPRHRRHGPALLGPRPRPAPRAPQVHHPGVDRREVRQQVDALLARRSSAPPPSFGNARRGATRNFGG